MSVPPYECPTRMAGPLTRPSVRLTVATSLLSESRLCWLAITSYPSAWSVGISLPKHDPSAHSPWTNTMLGLVCIKFLQSRTGSSHRVRFPAHPLVDEWRGVLDDPESRRRWEANVRWPCNRRTERRCTSGRAGRGGWIARLVSDPLRGRFVGRTTVRSRPARRAGTPARRMETLRPPYCNSEQRGPRWRDERRVIAEWRCASARAFD